MIFVHSKMGCLVPVLFFGLVITARILTPQPPDGPGPYWPWVVPLAVLLSGAILIWIGSVARRVEGRVVWDPRRQRFARLGAGHTFFWIDMVVWGWMIVGLAATLAWQAWRAGVR